VALVLENVTKRPSSSRGEDRSKTASAGFRPVVFTLEREEKTRAAPTDRTFRSVGEFEALYRFRVPRQQKKFIGT